MITTMFSKEKQMGKMKEKNATMVETWLALKSVVYFPIFLGYHSYALHFYNEKKTYQLFKMSLPIYTYSRL